MTFLAAAVLPSTLVVASPASATSVPPPGAEAERELDFTAWAQANGVPFDRFACDVTPGEGDMCFVLAGDAPLYEGDPGYRSSLDRDADGVACE